MALQVVSPKVSVYKVTEVKDGQEQATEHTFSRGELLPDWVSPYQQFVLTQTGMARQVGDFPDPNLTKPEDEPAPVIMPEHSPQSVVADHTVSGPMEVTGPDAAARGGQSADGELPDDTATKPVWEDFAVNQLGDKSLSRSAAESMKKSDLLAEVKARHSARKAEK